jgi:hypothetical protein
MKGKITSKITSKSISIDLLFLQMYINTILGNIFHINNNEVFQWI